MANIINFPRQMLPYTKKTKQWMEDCVRWAQNKTYFNFALVRNTIIHKKINADLVNGKLHMSDLELILNPDNLNAGYIPDRIQHYPILNSKLNVLRGEESKRLFDFRLIVTNPNAVSEIEENKLKELVQSLQSIVQNQELSEEEAQKELEKVNDYYNYEWQDLKEIRGNAFLNHYIKEYNIPLMFNNGFMNAMTFGEEIYQCDIIGGEPVIEPLNPLKVRVFKSGYSNKIEDADIIIIEDYWSPGRVLDTFYDSLTDKDIKYIEAVPDHVGQGEVDNMDNLDDRYGFAPKSMIDDVVSDNQEFFFDPAGAIGDGYNNSLLPYDVAGNLRVLRLYWKSKRAIKKVKSYNQETGEEIYEFYPENYVEDKEAGEEVTKLWINEAWEGTMIGDSVFINMGPRTVQYNRASNPSRCHFGIIGSIYNFNDSKPFSFVDMMKPYAYLYDIIHDRLNKAIAANWGTMFELDLAQVPKGWEIDKWLYYAKVNHLAIKDSFKQGNIGAAKGVMAGNFASNSRGAISTNDGNYIQQQINLLEFIKMEMSEIVGISKQREGQISNRETVGGVERATLQSSHITEWLFTIHDDIKKRVLTAFLETAKIAYKGRKIKFDYILPDKSLKMMEIDGDEFAEADYGLVVDNDEGTQKLNSQLDTLAQAALQNQILDFSSIMKLYSSSSMAEKQRMVEKKERELKESQSQAQKQQEELQKQLVEKEMKQKQEELSAREAWNIRDNETKIMVAQLNAGNNSEDGISESSTDLSKQELLEKIRQFDAKLAMEKDKLNFLKDKQLEDASIKRKSINNKFINKK